MKKISFLLLAALCLLACNTTDDIQTPVLTPQNFKILALGDSYTIGASVCEACRFPNQLTDSLADLKPDADFSLKIIAQTGWTTTALINAIANENLTDDYDLVTLLIGVNNQYQNRPFSLYETEFPELVSAAIASAKGDSSKLIVVSIPDYAFTPFGQNSSNLETISEALDQYNAFAESYCNQENITFVYITDITRQGLENPSLVASDGLHPSELAYTEFVGRLLPLALAKIE